jgi:hypothetical protein
VAAAVTVVEADLMAAVAASMAAAVPAVEVVSTAVAAVAFEEAALSIATAAPVAAVPFMAVARSVTAVASEEMQASAVVQPTGVHLPALTWHTVAGLVLMHTVAALVVHTVTEVVAIAGVTDTVDLIIMAAGITEPTVVDFIAVIISVTTAIMAPVSALGLAGDTRISVCTLVYCREVIILSTGTPIHIITMEVLSTGRITVGMK